MRDKYLDVFYDVNGMTSKTKNPDFIKQFDAPTSFNRFVSWIHKTIQGTNYITPADQTKNILIPKDLFVVGSINNPSDVSLKANIKPIENSELLFDIEPKQYTLISEGDKLHYGIVAQDLERIYPNLVNEIVLDVATVKTVNYLELIPLLIIQIKVLKEEINVLKEEINKNKVPM
jgi:hypothetical protein